MMSDQTIIPPIFTLPNELFLKILIRFSATELLTWATTSTRMYYLILRLLHNRMHNAASLDNEQHKIILECYHPANKTTQPYLFCDFLGTPGLTDDSSSIYEDPAADNGGQFGHLGRLSNLFSRFRPIRPEVEARIFRTHPAGGLLPIRPNVFFESGNDESGGSSTIDGDEEGDKLVEHSVSLDADESFSQLCVVTSLVKLGPRRGVFARYVPVSDGVIRVWRDWLADRASERKAGENEPQPDSSGSTRQTSEDGERRVLWLDNRRNIGLKVKIKEKKWQRPDAPVLLHRDEEDIVCYSMEYEELLIRTTHLMLAVEDVSLQGLFNSGSGKAMVFGSFVTRGPIFFNS